MKNIFKYISILLLAMITVVPFGCAGIDEFKSETLDSPVVLALTLGTVKDSSIVINAVNPSNGYITLGIMPGSAGDIDAEAFFKQNSAGITFLTKKALKDQTVSFLFSELTQYTDYTVIGVSSNADGVIGEPVEIIVKTADENGPELLSTSPEFDGELAPVLSTDCKIVLAFDEPVVYHSNKVVKLEYYNDDITIQGSDLIVNDSDKYVTISSKILARNREIIFISWEEGAFTDMAGNPVAKMESGLDEDYNLLGLYMRVVVKSFSPESYTPSADTVVAADFTKIELIYTENVGGFYKDYIDELVDPMTVTYEDVNGDQLIKVVPGGNVTWAGNEASIALPVAPVSGQTVYFNMNASTLKIGISNPAAAFSKSWVME